MKIGVFTDSYMPLPNGVATGVDRTVRALEKRGHEVSVIAPSVPGYKDERDNVYRLPSLRFVTSDSRFALHIPNRVMLSIVKYDFDIIHAHNGGPISFLGWEIAKAKKIPYVFTYWTLGTRYTHYFWNGKLMSPRMMQFISKVICNFCDYLIAPTNRVKKELRSYGVSQPINVIPTGIELEKYTAQKKGFIRNKIKVGKDTKILLHVGRLGKEKSIDFLIKAFAEVRKKHTDTVFVLIGTGNEELSLKALVAELHVEDFVYFLGAFHPDLIPEVYADADIFTFASETETQGMVLFESLASALPIVAVEDDVFEGILLNGENSYLVPKEEHLFAEKVGMLLQNEKLRKKFAASCLRTAQKFSIEKTAEILEKHYEKLIDSRSRDTYMTSFKNFITKPLFLMRKD